MAKLRIKFSNASIPISSAISEGRPQDAMDALVRELESGKADSAVQRVAAHWIQTLGVRPGDAKALRAGRSALPREWLEIAEMAASLHSDGRTYAEAEAETAKYYGYSPRHVQKCIAMWNEAKREALYDHE